MFVVFDLDGTLALTDHRSHFLTSEPKDWGGFYAACDEDEPCGPLILTLKAFVRQDHRVEIWSGRSAEVADKTAAWLSACGLGNVPIRMRPEGDHQPDNQLKLKYLKDADQKPDLIFEDRASVVQMWREQGIICAQVAPGDF